MNIWSNESFEMECGQARRVVPKGWVALSQPKPGTYHYSYSNAESQGALICETHGFPAAIDPKRHGVAHAYSDRMAGWDSERFNKACKLAGGGDQVWAYRLPSLVHHKLIEFAKVALNIEDKRVTAVRVVHHFNVATGYSCPTVEAVYEKESPRARA